MRIVDPRARSPLQRSVSLLDGSKSPLFLFYEAEAVVSRLEYLQPGIRMAVHSLENYINALTIQRDRIDENQGQAESLFDRYEQTEDPEAELAGNLRVAMIFLDVHFYFICLDKFVKLFRLSLDILARLARGAPDPTVIRSKRTLAERAFNQASQHSDTARNFHEHLDKEIATRQHPGFRARGTALGVELTFGAPPNQLTVEVGNLGPVYTAYDKLIDYANSLPA